MINTRAAGLSVHVSSQYDLGYMLVKCLWSSAAGLVHVVNLHCAVAAGVAAIQHSYCIAVKDKTHVQNSPALRQSAATTVRSTAILAVGAQQWAISAWKFASTGIGPVDVHP